MFTISRPARQVRRWADEIAMRREIVERVTRRWGEYGLRSQVEHYSALEGAARFGSRAAPSSGRRFAG
jgi:hypothetical protein